VTKHDVSAESGHTACRDWAVVRNALTHRGFLAAVEEGAPDRRVYERGYCYGVRARLGLPAASPLHQQVPGRSGPTAPETVTEHLRRRGLYRAFAEQFFSGMVAALGDRSND
jgi:hypothetical protein